MSTVAVYPKLNEGVSATAETEKKNPLSPNELKLQAIFKKSFNELSDSHQFKVRFIKGVRIFAWVAAPLSFLGTLAVASPLAKVALVISGIFFAIIIWGCPIMIRTQNRAFIVESTLHKINTVEHLFTDIKVMVSQKPSAIGVDSDKKQLTLDDFPVDSKSAFALDDDIARAIMEKISSILRFSGEVANAGRDEELSQMLGQLNALLIRIKETEKTQGISQAKFSLHNLKELLESVEARILEAKKICTAAYFRFLDKKK